MGAAGRRQVPAAAVRGWKAAWQGRGVAREGVTHMCLGDRCCPRTAAQIGGMHPGHTRQGAEATEMTAAQTPWPHPEPATKQLSLGTRNNATSPIPGFPRCHTQQ